MRQPTFIYTEDADLWGNDVSGALAKLATSLGAQAAIVLRVSHAHTPFRVSLAWSESHDGSEKFEQRDVSDQRDEIAIAKKVVEELLRRADHCESEAVVLEGPIADTAAGRIGEWAIAAIDGERLGIAVILIFPDRPQLTPAVAASIESFSDLSGSIYRRNVSEMDLRLQLEVERTLAALAETLVEVDAESAEIAIGSALAEMGRGMDCRIATIWDDGDDGLVHRTHVWVNPEHATLDDYPIDAIPLDHPISVRARSGSGVIRFADHFLATDSRVSNTLVAAQLTNDGEVTGAVTIGFSPPPGIDGEIEIERWSSIAAGLAALISQLRRRAKSEMAQTRSQNLDRVGSELARMFVDANSSDTDKVTRDAIKHLGKFLGARSVCYYEFDSSTGDTHLEASWVTDPSEDVPLSIECPCSDPGDVCPECGRYVTTVEADGAVVGELVCNLSDSLSDSFELRGATNTAATLLSQFRRRTDAERSIARHHAADLVLREVASDLIGVHADIKRALDRLADGMDVAHISLWRDASSSRSVGRARIDCMARAGDVAGRTHAYLPASVAASYPEPGDILEYPLEVVPKWLESVVGHALEPAARVVSIAVTQIDADEVIGLFAVSNGSNLASEIQQQTLVRATAMLAQHQARLAAEDTFAAAFESAPTAITIRDADGALIACNQAYLAFTGKTKAEVMDTRVDQLLVDGGGDVQHPRVGQTVELPYRRPGGGIRWGRVQFNSVTLAGRSEPVLLSHIEDITESRQAEKLVLHRATHDSLTELPNRDGFFGSPETQGSTAGGAVMVVDLDHFGAINDTLGHHIGDMALVTASDRMRLTLRPEDQICRLGGDEFAIYMVDGVTEREVAAVATRLLAMMQEPMRLGGRNVSNTLSIGAVMGSESHTVPELVRFADTAMYQAKKHGRDRYVMFDDELRRELADRLNLESELRVAFGSGQFVVYYQPEVDLSTGQVLGTEALLRWNHPERGIQTAVSFIEVAEEVGLIVELGSWVLREATRQAAMWRQAGHDLMMRVNLSTRQLRPAVIAEIRDSLLAAGLRPEHLCLEITETAIMDDVEESVRLLHQISDLGVKLAIDDFGTGYSSLAYLKRFPVDILKIDKAFVGGVGLNDQDTGIVDTVIRLGRALGLDVVAEGIENSQQLDDLVKLGCRRGQGFHMAKPAPASTITSLLESPAQH